MSQTKSFYCPDCRKEVDAFIEETLENGVISYQCPNLSSNGLAHGFYDQVVVEQEPAGFFYCPICDGMVPGHHDDDDDGHYCHCHNRHDNFREVGYFERTTSPTQETAEGSSQVEETETNNPSFDDRLQALEEQYGRGRPLVPKESWFKRTFGTDLWASILLIDRIQQWRQKQREQAEQVPAPVEYDPQLKEAQPVDPDTGETISPEQDEAPFDDTPGGEGRSETDNSSEGFSDLFGG